MMPLGGCKTLQTAKKSIKYSAFTGSFFAWDYQSEYAWVVLCFHGYVYSLHSNQHGSLFTIQVCYKILICFSKAMLLQRVKELYYLHQHYNSTHCIHSRSVISCCGVHYTLHGIWLLFHRLWLSPANHTWHWFMNWTLRAGVSKVAPKIHMT